MQAGLIFTNPSEQLGHREGQDHAQQEHEDCLLDAYTQIVTPVGHHQ